MWHSPYLSFQTDTEGFDQMQNDTVKWLRSASFTSVQDWTSLFKTISVLCLQLLKYVTLIIKVDTVKQRDKRRSIFHLYIYCVVSLCGPWKRHLAEILDDMFFICTCLLFFFFSASYIRAHLLHSLYFFFFLNWTICLCPSLLFFFHIGSFTAVIISLTLTIVHLQVETHPDSQLSGNDIQLTVIM